MHGSHSVSSDRSQPPHHLMRRTHPTSTIAHRTGDDSIRLRGIELTNRRIRISRCRHPSRGLGHPNIIRVFEISGVVHLDTPSVRKASPGTRSNRSSLPIGRKSLSSPRVSIVRPQRAGTTLKFEGSNPTGHRFHPRATSPGRDTPKRVPCPTHSWHTPARDHL